jgi:hypothetical protein
MAMVAAALAVVGGAPSALAAPQDSTLAAPRDSALATPRDKDDFTITGKTTCADAGGRWKVTWTVNNRTNKTAFVTEVEAVEPYARERYEGQVAAGGAKVDGFFEGVAVPKARDPKVTGTLVLDGSQQAAQINLNLRWDEPEQTYDIGRMSEVVEKPEPCESEPTPASSAGNAQPVGLRPVGTSTCTDLSIGLNTPIDAEIGAAEFAPSNGEKQTVTLEAGHATTVKFSAVAGLSVQVTLIGGQGWSETLAWKQPANCAAAAAAPQPAGQPSTTNATPIALAAGGVALVLVVGGAWLFTAHRRRQS